MNTEDRLRSYFVGKAATLEIPSRPMPAAPPSIKRTRAGTMLLATAAALVLIGLPVVVLSLVADQPSGVEEPLPLTTDAPVTTTTVTTNTMVPAMDSPAMARFAALIGSEERSSIEGTLFASVPPPIPANLPSDIAEQLLRTPTSADAGELGFGIAYQVLNDQPRWTPFLLTGINEQTGSFAVVWVAPDERGSAEPVFCAAVFEGDGASWATACAAPGLIESEAIEPEAPSEYRIQMSGIVRSTAAGFIRPITMGSGNLPLETSYTVLSGPYGDQWIQRPVSGTVLFAVDTPDPTGSYELSAYDQSGNELGRGLFSVSVNQDTTPPATSCHDTEISRPAGTVLTFYATCIPHGIPYPIYRPGSTAPALAESLTALLAGTNPAERTLGLYTGFDGVPEVSQVEVAASIDGAGTAHVELLLDGNPWLADTASWSSDQLLSLLDPLQATVFANEAVTGLDMTTLCFEQIACDRVVTRAEWEGILFTNTGALLHQGCTPEWAWWSPQQCTLDGVLAQPTSTATVVNVAEDDTLMVRAGAGSEYFVHFELANGTPVVATAETAPAIDGGIWHLINYSQGGAGWVNSAYLDVTATPAEALVDAFVTFAHDPSDATFATLPLADSVDLGLGGMIIGTVGATELRQPDAWQIDIEYFSAATGPFSAFDILSELETYVTTVGEHPHCASPPVPPPAGYEELDRISVQPRLGIDDSCLMWNTIDFLVLPDGDVAVITLDMWEP